MRNIERRLNELEKTINPPATRLIWLDDGQSEKAAIAHATANHPLATGESVMFVRWQTLLH